MNPSSEVMKRFNMLRENFDGRRAIFIEQGVVYLRISSMICNTEDRQVQAIVEEIPTLGLQRNLISFRNPSKHRPLKWRIKSGFLTRMSANAWTVGYGGFQLYVSPELVAGIRQLAAGFPTNGHPVEIYNQALKYISANSGYIEKANRLFPHKHGEHGLIKQS
jgi:hypothetical protein